MSNKTLEKVIILNMAMALLFGMIIKGKIGVVGFTIFFIITLLVGWIYQKRTGTQRKMDLIEKIVVIGVFIIMFPFCYLVAFKPDYKIVDLLMILFLVWLFGGLILLSIRAKKKRRGY